MILRYFAATLLLTLSVATQHIEAAENERFVPPASPRQTYSLNVDWRFVRAQTEGAEQAKFDDSQWTRVSLPHTWNDVDTYRAFISHFGGDQSGQYFGIGWYRKRFKLPAGAADGKVFLECEGLKQAAHFFLNGHAIGKYENGVTAVGFDLTPWALFGKADNVLAIKVDNSENYQEEATGMRFSWMNRSLNPNYGGLTRNVWLHLTGKVYQTLPLYENLQTTGVYVSADTFDIPGKSARVSVQSQVRNETSEEQMLTLSSVVVGANGQVCARWQGAPTKLAAGQTEVLSIGELLREVRFWSVEDPALYDVYSIVSAGGKPLDVCKISTGFRKVEFKGGAGTGGVWLNDRFVYLKGYAQHSVNDWAGLGPAYPDWMHDWTVALLRGSNGNHVRWMHVAPQRSDVLACDRSGVIQACPGADHDSDTVGRQWEQRIEVMRTTMIYYRNQPSILLWEAGNGGISSPHLQQMVDLRKKWDPTGGRAMGCRSLHIPATTPIAEYFGVMVGQDSQTDKLFSYTSMFRSYSAERRDRVPMFETEDLREEGARRYWDDFSPPHFGFKRGPRDTYGLNSESFALAAAERYFAYDLNRISNPDRGHSKWAGYASLFFSDSNADGRQESSEVCRVSGKVDSVRLPKEAYSVYRVMQSDVPDLHIIGHWSYPMDTKKAVYVAASHCDAVELVLNGQPLGKVSKPINGCIFAFPDVAFSAGVLKAVGTLEGKRVCAEELQTAGEPSRLKLTPHTGPSGWQADGSDVVLLDVEVVDAQGRRCPTDEARIDFSVEGSAVWRGGYNSGTLNSTNNLYLNTECGINRVALRSTLTPGQVKITAARAGLSAATLEVSSKAVRLNDGLLLPR